MESLLELGDFLWPLPDFALSENQIRSYGKYLLLLASSFYLSVSLKSAVPADTRHAIEAHLPQGFDRSVVDARLQQRRSKELLQQCLQLNEQRDRLRREVDREAKLRGWNEVFRLNLVGIVAAAYTHSLTMSLFAVKNTVRVLVFLLRQREEARLQQKQNKKDTNRSSGPLLKVKTWWAGGMQSLLTSVLISQLSKKAQLQQGSPFATVGVGEDLPLPVPPCTLTNAEPNASYTIDVVERDITRMQAGGGGGAMCEMTTTTTTMITAGGHTGLSQDHTPHSHRHRINYNNNDNEEDASYQVGGGGAQRRPHAAALSLAQRRRQRQAQEEYLTMMMAEAERAFSVKVVLEAAVPAIVACANRVVSFALSQRPAHMFNAASVVSEKELRALLRDIASQFEREACVAEWVRQSTTTTTTPKVNDPYNNNSNVGHANIVQPPSAGLTSASNATSANASIALNGTTNNNGEGVQQGRQATTTTTTNTATNTANPSTRTSTSPMTTTTTTSSSDEDIIDFPAGSTVMIGPDGRPIRRTHAHSTQPTYLGGANNNNVEEMDIEMLFGANGLDTAEERAAHLAALRREQLLKQLTATYFQKIIHSASFAELCLSYAGELLDKTINAASCLHSVKSYDAATHTARMLMVIPALDIHRQHLFDADFTIQPYLKLFCEEMVRSTCS